MKYDYKKIFESTWQNIDILKEKEFCGCWWCTSTFKSGEITKWEGKCKFDPLGQSKSACCPHCGMVAVIPENDSFELTSEFLGSIRFDLIPFLICVHKDYLTMGSENNELCYLLRHKDTELTFKAAKVIDCQDWKIQRFVRDLQKIMDLCEYSKDSDAEIRNFARMLSRNSLFEIELQTKDKD